MRLHEPMALVSPRSRRDIVRYGRPVPVLEPMNEASAKFTQRWIEYFTSQGKIDTQFWDAVNLAAPGRNVEPSSIQQSRLSTRNNHLDQREEIPTWLGSARSERKHPSSRAFRGDERDSLACTRSTQRGLAVQKEEDNAAFFAKFRPACSLGERNPCGLERPRFLRTKVSQGVRDTRRLDASQKTHSSQMSFAKPSFQPALHNVNLIPKLRWQILFILVMICQSFLGCRNFFAKKYFFSPSSRTSGNCDIFWSISRRRPPLLYIPQKWTSCS